MDLSVSYIYGEALELAKKHGLKVMALLCFAIIVSIGTNLLSLPADFLSTYSSAISTGNSRAMERMLMQSSDASILLTFVQYAVSFILSCMTYALVLGCIRKSQTGIVGAIKALAPTTYLKFIVVNCLYGLMIFLGCLLFVVPGVFLGVRFAWAPFYIIEHQDAGIGQSLRWSWNASKDRVLELIGLALIALVLIAVGCIVIGIVIGLGCIGNTATIVVCAIVGLALLLWVCAFINFAQARVYCELHSNTMLKVEVNPAYDAVVNNGDTTTSDC